jgi:CheY-like chemotaxis protein
VRVAEDGHSALRQTSLQRPDILLSDLQMPGISGRELLDSVRVLFPAIKAIATSGSFGGNEVPAGVLADAFYSKGSLSALLQILRELPLMRRRSPDALTTERRTEIGSAEIVSSAPTA